MILFDTESLGERDLATLRTRNEKKKRNVLRIYLKVKGKILAIRADKISKRDKSNFIMGLR